MYLLIYVIDLDGTLCDTKRNKVGYWDYIGAKPYLKRIKFVNKLYQEGHTIIIETARGCDSKKDWSDETSSQLKKWGLRFHKLRTGKKFAADLYIDDKAVNSVDFFKDVNDI